MATPELDQDHAPDAEPTPLTEGGGKVSGAPSEVPRGSVFRHLRHLRELLDMINFEYTFGDSHHDTYLNIIKINT